MPQRSRPHGACAGLAIDGELEHRSSATRTSPRRVPPIACLLAVALTVSAGSARADLWGYLDEQGAAHFATEKLDDRYQLFFKGETNLDAAARARTEAAAPGADLARSRMYQYVTR